MSWYLQHLSFAFYKLVTQKLARKCRRIPADVDPYSNQSAVVFHVVFHVRDDVTVIDR